MATDERSCELGGDLAPALSGGRWAVVKMFASAAELRDAETQKLTCAILDHHMPHMTGLELAERFGGIAQAS